MLSRLFRNHRDSQRLSLTAMAAVGFAVVAAPALASLALAGDTLTTLASFNGTDGANPIAGLTLSGSTLYGTTSSGGGGNNGTVFAITTPEPSTWDLLAACATAGLLLRRRRRMED